MAAAARVGAARPRAGPGRARWPSETFHGVKGGGAIDDATRSIVGIDAYRADAPAHKGHEDRVLLNLWTKTGPGAPLY